MTRHGTFILPQRGGRRLCSSCRRRIGVWIGALSNQRRVYYVVRGQLSGCNRCCNPKKIRQMMSRRGETSGDSRGNVISWWKQGAWLRRAWVDWVSKRAPRARERETTFRAYWLLQRGSIKRQRVVVYTKRGSCRRHPIPSPPRLIMKKRRRRRWGGSVSPTTPRFLGKVRWKDDAMHFCQTLAFIFYWRTLPRSED